MYSGYSSERKLLRPESKTTTRRSGWVSWAKRINMRENTYSAPVGMPSLVDSRTSRRSPREAFIRPKWARNR